MRLLLSSLIALAGAAACPSLAFAQASPADHMYASRYDLEGRVVGKIAPDPDGAGPLTFQAARNSYDSRGLLTLAEEGVLSSWPGDSDPGAWSGFTVLTRVETQYDALGRKSVVTVRGSDNVATALTQYGYTASGQLECTAQRMNPAAFGSLPASACALGAQGSQGPDRITRNVYDDKLQLEVVQKAVGTPLQQEYVRYVYTNNGKQRSVTDANGATAVFTYDSLDRLQRWYFPSKTTAGIADQSDYEEYGYDGNSNRTSLRKRDGRTLTFAFDALDRVTSKTVPDGCAPIQVGACPAASATRDVHYEYDLRGLQLSARFDGPAGEGLINTYDGSGRLLTATNNMGGTSRTLASAWDLNSNRIQIAHPDGAYAGYDHDGLDRMTGYRENGWNLLATLTYDSAGRRLGLGLQGTSTAYGYHPSGQLASQSHAFAGGTGNVTISFGYNSASQIVSRARTNDAYVFSGHSVAGRRYTVNGLNQYTAAGSTGFTYDANGNLVTESGIAYGYDAENRLVSASTGASLVYDPLGRLFQTSGGSAGITQFLYDGDDLVSEFDSAGTIIRRYVHGPGTDDPLLWYEGPSDWDRRSVLADHQGSIVAVANAAGVQTAINSYDEWGIPGPGNQGRFQYTGQAWIPELGMYHYKARLYSPSLGRFLQTDPIGYEGGLNLYGYVDNDPVNSVDPEGESPRRASPQIWIAQNSRYSNPLTHARAMNWERQLQTKDPLFRSPASISSPGLRYRSDAEANFLSGAYAAREQAGLFGYNALGSTMQANGFSRVLMGSNAGGLNNSSQHVSGSGTYQYSQIGSATAALEMIVGSNYRTLGNTLLARNVPFGNGVSANINVHPGSGQNRSGFVLEATFSAQRSGSNIPEVWRTKIEFTGR